MISQTLVAGVPAGFFSASVAESDPALAAVLSGEFRRQQEHIRCRLASR